MSSSGSCVPVSAVSSSQAAQVRCGELGLILHELLRRACCVARCGG